MTEQAPHREALKWQSKARGLEDAVRYWADKAGDAEDALHDARLVSLGAFDQLDTARARITELEMTLKNVRLAVVDEEADGARIRCLVRDALGVVW